ncbi:transcriptional regulator, DeoR family [Micrococcales bacterium KH10]|nr:transcriptional regulator, DeoR family [Micrococcales bacterium KH10]
MNILSHAYQKHRHSKTIAVRSNIELFICTSCGYDERVDQPARITRILSALHEHGQVTVSQLAADLDTSPMTIRRDLGDLDAQGMLRRTHGGARLPEVRSGVNTPFAVREHEHVESKARLAAAARQLLRDDELIALDSGTTCAHVARTFFDLAATVTAVSLPVAAILATADDIEVVMPGGTLRHDEGSLAGPATTAYLRSLNFDVAIISGCGTSLDRGITSRDPLEADVKRALIERATRSIVVCDRNKWGTASFIQVAELASIDVLVTDATLTASEQNLLKQHNVSVVTV